MTKKADINHVDEEDKYCPSSGGRPKRKASIEAARQLSKGNPKTEGLEDEENDEEEVEENDYEEELSEDNGKKAGGTKKKTKKICSYIATEQGRKNKSDTKLKILATGSSNLPKSVVSARSIGNIQYLLTELMKEAASNRTIVAKRFNSLLEGKKANDGLEDGIVVYGKTSMSNSYGSIGLDGWTGGKVDNDTDDDAKGKYMRRVLCQTVALTDDWVSKNIKKLGEMAEGRRIGVTLMMIPPSSSTTRTDKQRDLSRKW